MAIKRASKKKNIKKKTPSKTWRTTIKKWSIRLIIVFFGLTITWVLLLTFINPPLTYLQLKRAFERKAIGKEWKIDKQWLDYEDISDNLKRAAIAGEDAYFLTHSGFDTKAIQKAMERNQTGKSLRGGSTISQQVAKNVFLWPQRSWLRKGLEAYFTVLIEAFWSKKRILEVYLNVIEMGQGVYGAEAAAHYYFHKSAKSLTRKEAALIIAILPSPQKWDAKRPSTYVNRRANSIVRYMSHYNIP
ncbi:monofunctional biosynthetic peptidoglycan transglycosylase [Sphingobacterium sp. SGR-19]|uniref:monofunctional biosynthetic peptidoglycan transglycosylase n=1 Tax=Sphingobacterium sp. SGR-19 TaxID=2710886 RepID=UPI0013ED0C60|nr:monofunctional biosynthetic peptidoglycan transglycosylase [Sphingobacterium sp. SGR-19]NGM64699.1 monofunctional biosynthetic peptidoglycan transglycosylase [Sphingobacterium sp. SGR-19]